VPSIANILVVDDRRENLMVIEAVLEPLGQRLVTATSGDEALRHALADDFAVIILDVRMPGIDGMQTAALIKARERSRLTPIIFLTGDDASATSALRGYAHGAVDFIQKPFEAEILRAKVSVFVELHLSRELIRSQEDQLRRQEHERTARAEAEAQRRHIFSLFMQAPTPICVTRGAEHRFELANPHYTRLTGDRALEGKTVREAFPDLEGQGLFEPMDRVFTTSEPFHGNEVAIRMRWGDAADDVERFFSFIYQPLVVDGKVDGVMTFAFEVTEQVAARRRVEAGAQQIILLQAATEALSLALTPTKVASVLTDHGMKAARADSFTLHVRNENEGTFVLVGHSGIADEVAAAVGIIHVDGDSPLAEAVRKAEPVWVESEAEYARLFPRLAPVPARRGKSFWCAPLAVDGRVVGVVSMGYDAARAFDDEHKAVVRTIARQCAQALERAALLHRAESARAEAVRLAHEAQDAVRVRDDFLSIASHELNTPLTPLKLQIAMLRGRKPEALAESLPKTLAIVDRQIDRLTKLVSTLLDVSRITAGRLALEPEMLDLAEVIRDVSDRFAPEASRCGSELRVRAEPGARGSFDRMRIEQIVTNVITNAIKYGSGKPIDVSLEVKSDGACARITVRDRGIGVPDEMRDRIFGRFERAVSSRHFGGFGLGLWIARQLVDASGGTIALDAVKDGEGAGSTFVVELPLRNAD
jgi:signal transduction histidine kinase